MIHKGRVPYHEHDDRDIREALAEALGERKVRLTDRRLLILYGLFVVLLLGLGAVVQTTDADRKRFQTAVISNCEANRANTISFNTFVRKVVRTYSTSPVLNAAQRRERVEFFAKAIQEIPTCPSGR